MYESACVVCNPVKDGKREMKEDKLSRLRSQVGVYVGESSRSTGAHIICPNEEKSDW